MIDVTVKTLDSQNHAFTLEDDITVKDFKEHITGTVDIPVDLQRLIYCGRVLQDDKRLSDYDVNGKVIHLVQRAPPSTTQRSSISSQNDNRSGGDFMSSPRIQYRQAQFHGNPMYVGSVSIPAEVLESNDWPIPQLSSSSTANSHLAIVRRMLDQANRVIDSMDNPDTSSNTDENTTAESEQTTSTVDTETTSSTSTATTTTTTTTTPPQHSPQEEQQQEDNAEQPAASTSNESTTENDNEGLVPRQLAELLEKLLTTQDRLSPYIRERILLTSDGSSSSTTQSDTTAEQNQRIIDGVTECFHFLSHAQHALSDMSVDMQQAPPRTVRCRSMMIPQSTIIQAGMPIQVEAHISLHGQSDSSNADSEDGSNNGPSRESTGSTVPPRTFSPTPESDETGETQSENTQQQQQQQQQATSGQNQSDNGFGSLFNFPSNVEVVMEMGPQAPRVWSFSTNGQGQTTSTSTGNNNNNNNNNNTNTSNNNANANGNNNNNNNAGSGGDGGGGGGGGGRTTTGGAGLDSFPWNGAPSPDIIRNLIQAVAGYMAQGSTASATSTSTPTSTNQSNSTSSNNSTPTIGLLRHRTMTVALGNNESTPGQTSQSRANTDTHPTTSTQTRTTPRTHVFHQHAQALGVAHSIDFDPFLPCNSPHLRRGQQAQNNTTTSTQTGQNTFSTSDNTTSLQAGTIRFGPGSGSGGSITGIGGIGGISGISPRFATVAGVQVINASNRRDRPLSETLHEAANRTAHPIALDRYLRSRGINIGHLQNPCRRNIIHLVFTLLSKMSIPDWFRIINGNHAPLTAEVGRSLRQLLRGAISSPTNYERQIVKLFIEALLPYIQSTFANEDAFDNNMRSIDLCVTVQQLIADRGTGIVRSILNEESFSGIVAAIRTFAVDMTRLIRFTLRGQPGFDRVIRKFASEMSKGTHAVWHQWINSTVVEWFCSFAQNIPVTTDDSIAAVVRLRYKETATTSINLQTAQTLSTLSTSSIDEASAQQELEPMEVDAASSEQPDNDPLALEDGEDVPTTFPGHEQLLPEWVPIIARDGSRQRRQLQLGITGENVTNLSDAYLSTMPTKRRKLVEQQKPTILTNTTSNNSPVPASMERLVRDSVERAGIDEVDGAASAVAADPTVRRAFGQAIRECLNPRRFQASDFPDSLRFPNASRLFTESDRSSQQ